MTEYTEWGWCHVELYPEVIRHIKTHFDHDIRITQATDMGDGIYHCAVTARDLRPGYHGSMNIILNGTHGVKFRREADV